MADFGVGEMAGCQRHAEPGAQYQGLAGFGRILSETLMMAAAAALVASQSNGDTPQMLWPDLSGFDRIQPKRCALANSESVDEDVIVRVPMRAVALGFTRLMD